MQKPVIETTVNPVCALLLSCENGNIPGVTGLRREGAGVLTVAGLSRVSSVSEQQWWIAACHPSRGLWAPDTVF